MQTQTYPTLNTKVRAESGKGFARRMRQAGEVPAACYGRDMETLNLAVNRAQILDALDGPRGLNTVFNVEVDGDDLSFDTVILQDYQVDPVSRALLHVDLMVVDKDEMIETEVPIKSVGRAAGEREGGRLTLLVPTVRVSCVALNIPDVLAFDVSDLGPAEVRMASELELPEGVEPAYPADFAIARVNMPRRNVVGLDDVEVVAEDVDEDGEELAEGEEAEGDESEE